MLMRTDPFRDLDRLHAAALRCDHRAPVRDADGRVPLRGRVPGPLRPPRHRPRDDRTRRRAQRPQRPRRAAPAPLPRTREMLVAERPTGTFTRQLFLGDTLDTDRIDASYEAGVLTLRIPVAEQAAAPHPDQRRRRPQADQRLRPTGRCPGVRRWTRAARTRRPEPAPPRHGVSRPHASRGSSGARDAAACRHTAAQLRHLPSAEPWHGATRPTPPSRPRRAHPHTARSPDPCPSGPPHPPHPHVPTGRKIGRTAAHARCITG